MLCDEVVSSPLIGEDLPFAVGRTIRDYRSMLALKLQQAQKFVLDNRLATAIDDVSKWRPSSTMIASTYAAVPFPLTWIEWDSNSTPPETSEMGAFDAPTGRVGLLIERDIANVISGRAWLFWNFRKRDGINASLLSVVFDFSEAASWEAVTPECAERECLDLGRKKVSGQTRFALKSEKERAAFIKQTQQFSIESDPSLPMALRKTPFWKGLSLDWGGEHIFLKSALIMMNTKNGTVESTSDLSRLNKARERKGKLPLFEFKLLKCRLTDRPASDGAYNNNPRAKSRVHLVRGHFKTRKTGVFFWHDYARGSPAAGIIEKRYAMAL